MTKERQKSEIGKNKKSDDDPRYRPELLKQQAVRESNTVRLVGLVLFLISVAIAFLGFISSNTKFSFSFFLNEFYANVSTELASIAITVLIIDFLNERRESRNLRGRLTREMGSEKNGFALRATAELRAYGWLLDGSLKNSYLRRANLYRANLHKASLEKCYLHKANLRLAFLGEADLRGADLSQSNLTGATFNKSNLQGADLTGAILESTKFIKTNLLNAKLPEGQFKLAKSFKESIMPNGEVYEIWRTQFKKKMKTS